MSDQRPTLKHVAERSGYALRTVKKVMAGEPVRPRTRAAVLQAADELRYTPNRAASALARHARIRLAVVYSRVSEAYFPEIDLGFRRCERDLRDFGLELEFFVADGDGWEAQRPLLQALLARDDICGVALQPYSGARLDADIDRLAEAGKPVVTFGADAPGSRRLCYVGPDAYRAGRIGGQVLANYIGKRGEVYVLNADGDHMQTRERCRGFMDRMREHYPEIHAHPLDVPGEAGRYYDAVREIVGDRGVAGIFCTDANTCVAGRALRDCGAKDVALVGFDLSPEGTRLMREGYIKVVIEQKPDVFAHQAAKLLFQYIAERRTPQPVNLTPLYIVTSECLDD